MHKKLLLILFLSFSIMVTALFGCGRHPSNEKPSLSTVLSITNGDVFIMKAHTSTWVKAQAGISLEVDDTIKAGDDSWATITFFEGSTIELEPGTEVSVATLNITSTGSTTIGLQQEIGRTVSRVKELADPASSYEVNTPTCVAAVRGSVMLVDVSENGTTIVGNGEGFIVVFAQGVEVQIPQGMHSVIAIGQSPGVPEQGLPFVPSGVAGNTVSLITSAGAGGSISPSGSVTVSSDTEQTFTITPDTGYHVADVLVDGVSVGAVTTYTFDSVSTNHLISATFAINTYTISTSAGAHGSITPANPTVNYSADQTFTITPNAHYYIADVLVDGISVGAVTSYTFSNVTANHIISATFSINTYIISTSAGAHGSITPTNPTVNYGADQVFIITTNAHYHIVDVLVDGVSVGAVTSYTFTNVTAGHTIAASFATDTFNITASAGAGGSILPSGNVTVNYGGNQTFAITPDTDYYVMDVLVDNVSVGAVTNYIFTNVTANHTIFASFATNTYTYTAVDDFSIENGNPNGVWSYGWMPTDFSSFNLYENTYLGTANSPYWYAWGADHTPGIWENLGDPAYSVPTVWLSLHPGNGWEPSVLRWTAPVAGAVRVTGQFLPGDWGIMQVAVCLDNQPWWQETDYGNFDLTTNVTSGTTIDFAVYGGYGYGNTPISTTISYINDTFNITASAGAGGSISPSGNVTVNYGGNQTFAITADTDYYIMDVLVDGVSVGAVTNYIFTNVIANHTISASFATDLIVDTNMTLEAGEYTFRDVIVTNNATLTLNSNPSLSGFQGVRINAQNVTIDPDSSILSDGMGYGAGSGTGVGAGTSGGGGYGGQGGAGYNGAGGIISANGANSNDNYCGSGSGGSIYVTTQTLAGSGSFTAHGGNSGNSGGGGGGGRIAIYYKTSSFTGTVEANGGTGANNGQDGTVVLLNIVLDPANGHYYELINESIDWTDARDAAASMEFAGLRGHLATITSTEENLWLTSTFTADGLHNHWIGGYQPPGSSEPDGGWTWVTGEPWSFSNWWPPYEPNNAGGDENSIMFSHGVLPETGKSWNDADGATLGDGYLVEYDNDWYVNPGESIQAAIDAGGGTVHVAAGTYYELISLRSGVVVQGAGANVTTIDGSNNGTVVTASGVDSTARLEDFTISHGSGSSGGGMRNEGSSPVVTNCTFSGNLATEGAGILCSSSSSPNITNCIIDSNSASWSGGGIECDLSSSPTISNCIISNNSANYGGGMQCNVM